MSKFAELMRAAELKSDDAIRDILLSGVSVDITDEENYTPAMRQAQQGNTDCADFLISHGADPLKVAMAAARENRQGYTEDLIEKHKLDLDRIAYFAAYGGRLNFTNSLIERGASIHEAAHGAIKGGRTYYISDLLIRGANPLPEILLSWDTEALQHLHIASDDATRYAVEMCKLGENETALRLIKFKEADAKYVVLQAVNMGDMAFAQLIITSFYRDLTELEVLAGTMNHHPLACHLIENHQADPLTIALAAALKGHVRLVAHLVQSHHADPTRVALKLLEAKRYAAAIACFQLGAVIQTCIIALILHKDMQGIQYLLDSRQSTQQLMRVAVAAKSVAIVRLLVERGVRFSHTDDITDVAKEALREGDFESVDLFKQHGADISQIAKAAASVGEDRYAEKLRAAGANIDDIVSGAALGKNYRYLEALIKSGVSDSLVVEKLGLGVTITDQKEIMNCLTRFSCLDMQQQLLRTLTDEHLVPASLKRTLSNRIQSGFNFLRSRHLSMPQAVAFIQNTTFRYFVLTAFHRRSNGGYHNVVNTDIDGLIGSQLLAGRLSPVEVSDTIKKLEFYDKVKSPLLDALKQYTWRVIANHRSRASKLILSIEACSSVGDLREILAAEQDDLRRNPAKFKFRFNFLAANQTQHSAAAVETGQYADILADAYDKIKIDYAVSRPDSAEPIENPSALMRA